MAGLSEIGWATDAALSIPAYPERTEDAHARYTAALQAIADRHTRHNILVVTHGEAVRSSVTRLVGNGHTSPHLSKN